MIITNQTSPPSNMSPCEPGGMQSRQVYLHRVGNGWACDCDEFQVNGCCIHFVYYAVAKIKVHLNFSMKGGEAIDN